MPESNRHAAGFEFWKTKRVNTSDPSSTLLLYHTKIFHASRKKPLGGERLFSGRKYSDTYSVTLRGEISVWCYYIMPLCFMQTDRKPPTSAAIDGSLRKDFRINFNFDSESTKTNFAITTATQSPFVFDYGARAPRRHVSSHSQQWIGSCHSITRRCRRGYFFEYE